MLKKIHRTQNAVVFGVGDYFDFARTAWRSHLKTYSQEDNFFDSLDKFVDESLVDPFCSLIKKHCPSFAEKCIVLVEGNHTYKYGSGGRQGQTSTQEICRRLDIPYGGLSAWVRMNVYNSKGSYKFGGGKNLNILLNHGQSSGGDNIASSLGKLEKQIATGWRNADVLFSAHNHKLGHITDKQIGVTQWGEPRLIDFPILVAKVGCFKKAYMPGAKSNSYEERQFFSPHQRGWFECSAKTFRGNEKKNGYSERWEFFDFNN